jgi:hypothetical protein
MDLALSKALESEIRQWRPAPQRQRFAQQLHPLVKLRVPRQRQQPLESNDIEAFWLDLEHITGRACDDRRGPKQLAQLRDQIA